MKQNLEQDGGTRARLEDSVQQNSALGTIQKLFGNKLRLAVPLLLALAACAPKEKHAVLKTVTEDQIIHVEKGDTLSQLSQKYGVSMETVKKANHLSSDTIHPGQSLTVPGQETERTVTLDELQEGAPNQYVFKEEGKWYSIRELVQEGAEKFPSKEWKDHPEWDESRLASNGNGVRHFIGELTEQPVTLQEVKFIVLHSTITSKSEAVSKTKKAHFVVERDGTVRYLIHIEKERPADGKATPHAGLSQWNGVPNLNEHSIGIEVVALEGQQYSPEENAAVKKLVEWLGGYFTLSKNAVLRHAQIAYGDHEVAMQLNAKFPKANKIIMCDGRGRKSDPIDPQLFENLGLPDNDRLLDLSVATGEIPFDLATFQRNKAPSEGLQAAVDLNGETSTNLYPCNK